MQKQTASKATASSDAHKTLGDAKRNKRDEYYTQLTDIEKELRHYTKHFKGATIFCNCDDPADSNFFRYFAKNFEQLGLKKVIATHFDNFELAYKLELTHGVDLDGNGIVGEEDVIKTPLKGNGDFRNAESIELLKEADIVVTNPPFSLFREYMAQLVVYDKNFIIMGNMNAVTYKEVFPLIKDSKIWWGASLNGSRGPYFRVPAHYENPKSKDKLRMENGVKYHRLDNVVWYANLDFPKRHETLDLWKKYTPDEYPKYDNYDAIEVSKVSEIPQDYDGIMGVPITFIGKYNPKQFNIVGCSYGYGRPTEWPEETDMTGTIGGKDVYKRILIRKIG